MTCTAIKYRAAPANPTRDGMEFCDEGRRGCGASLTATDFQVGFCTQCHAPITTMKGDDDDDSEHNNR